MRHTTLSMRNLWKDCLFSGAVTVIGQVYFGDLYIEKVLMGSVKSVGGLTRGRGFKESTSLIWLLFTPACGEVHKAMQEETGHSSTSAGEIHKDLAPSKLKRDANDLQSMLDYLTEITIFK